MATDSSFGGSKEGPQGGSESAATLNGVPWQFIIQPYVKSYQLFACPSNTQNTKVVDMTNGLVPVSYVCRGGGGQTIGWGGVAPMNRAIPSLNSDFSTAQSEAGGRTLAELIYPSTTILIGENTGPRTEPDMWALGDFDSGNTKFTNHLGTTNVLFGDGHAKAMKPAATGTPLNMWVINNNSVFGDSTPGPGPSTLLTRLVAQQTAMN